MDLQPFLHDLLAAVQAPTQAWSARDGQVRPEGAQGFYHGDVRVLSSAVVTVGGAEPEAIQAAPSRRQEVHVVAAVRVVDEPDSDPTARLDRVRAVRPGRVDEVLRLSCSTRRPVVGRVTLRLRADDAALDQVRRGSASRAPAVRVGADGRGATWASRSVRVSVEAPGATVSAGEDDASLVVEWDV